MQSAVPADLPDKCNIDKLHKLGIVKILIASTISIRASWEGYFGCANMRSRVFRRQDGHMTEQHDPNSEQFADIQRFKKALTALPADLAGDVDRMLAHLRNSQAKKVIRMRLQQHTSGGKYYTDNPNAGPST
jgi:hypothetical protein